MNLKLESRLPGEISTTSDMQMTYPNGWRLRGTKEPLDEGERGEWKADLKLNFKKAKIMTSAPITSWQIDVKNVEKVTDFIFLGSKITLDGDCMKLKDACSLEEKLCQTLMAYWTAETSLRPYSQSYGFSCSLIWLLELDHKEGP